MVQRNTLSFYTHRLVIWTKTRDIDVKQIKLDTFQDSKFAVKPLQTLSAS